MFGAAKCSNIKFTITKNCNLINAQRRKDFENKGDILYFFYFFYYVLQCNVQCTLYGIIIIDYVINYL